MQCCKVILQGLRTADQLNAAIFLQQKLRTAQLAVIVESHGMTVGARIMKDQTIPNINFGQFAVNCEFVVVFTK